MTNLSLKIIQTIGYYFKKWGGDLEYIYHKETSRRFMQNVKKHGKNREQLVASLYGEKYD